MWQPWSNLSCDAAVAGLDDSLNCAPVKGKALCAPFCVFHSAAKITMRQGQYL